MKPITRVPKGTPPLCKCGCGAPVAWRQSHDRWDVYIVGHYRQDAPYKDRAWLEQEYVVKVRSLVEIAEQCNVNHTTIVKALRKCNIPTRTTSESLALRGTMRASNNPAWKGGVAKWFYAFNWKRIMRQIRKRDNYTCQSCHETFPKSSKLLHVHHIDGNKFNNDFSNLVCVCATCHPKGKRKEKRFAETI